MAQRLRQLVELRDKALDVLSKRLDDVTLAELWRMGHESSRPDGFPARTLGDGGSSGSDETSSTEAAALYGLEEATGWAPKRGTVVSPAAELDSRSLQADPLRDAVASIWTNLAIAGSALRKIDDTLEYTGNAGDAARGAEGKDVDVVLCAACSLMILRKLHTIDGQPYHDGKGVVGGKAHGDCYGLENRRLRKLRGESVPELEERPDELTWAPFTARGLPPAEAGAGGACSAGHHCCAGQAGISGSHEHYFPPAECPSCNANAPTAPAL